MSIILWSPIMDGKCADGSDTPAFKGVEGEDRARLMAEVEQQCVLEIKDALAKMARLHPALRTIVNEGLYVGSSPEIAMVAADTGRIPPPPPGARMFCGKCHGAIDTASAPGVMLLCESCLGHAKKKLIEAPPTPIHQKH